jgi:Ser-tRNA(Ala) deacylase AlaX
MKHVGRRVHHPIEWENNQKYASAHTLTHVLACPMFIVFTSGRLICFAHHHEAADR